MNNLSEGKVFTKYLVNLLLIYLLYNCCILKPKKNQVQGQLSADKLQQAIDYIQSNLAEDISLESIANELGISRYYFCRLFKKSMGISPYQYLIQSRIERAKELLLQPHISISDVALKVGFSSQSHFTKYFKKVVGITPKEFENFYSIQHHEK